jgi:hypothetical protein
VLVAHNCAFKRMFLPDDVTGGQPWICTYKAALHVWPDAPKHSNKVLRYWRGLALDAALAMPPHRAGPDAWVTANILSDLLKFASVAQMIEWTSQPRPMPVITFGKHKGTAWADVPADHCTGQPDRTWMATHCGTPRPRWLAASQICRPSETKPSGRIAESHPTDTFSVVIRAGWKAPWKAKLGHRRHPCSIDTQTTGTAKSSMHNALIGQHGREERVSRAPAAAVTSCQSLA